MNELRLDLTIQLLPEDKFQVDFLEPESGSTKSVVCHQVADALQAVKENQELTDEIRSWANLLLEREDGNEE